MVIIMLQVCLKGKYSFSTSVGFCRKIFDIIKRRLTQVNRLLTLCNYFSMNLAASRPAMRPEFTAKPIVLPGRVKM